MKELFKDVLQDVLKGVIVCAYVVVPAGAGVKSTCNMGAGLIHF